MAVTPDRGFEIPHPESSGRAEAMTEVTERLSALAESVDRHERVIKRAIKIAEAYFRAE